VFVDDFDKCVIRNTKSVGFVWKKCQLKRKILEERESRHFYVEVKVPDGSTGVSE